MYSKGEGVPKNTIIAYMLYNLAEVSGIEIAITNRDLLAKSMTAEQIAEAKTLSNNWRIGQSLP